MMYEMFSFLNWIFFRQNNYKYKSKLEYNIFYNIFKSENQNYQCNQRKIWLNFNTKKLATISCLPTKKLPNLNILQSFWDSIPLIRKKFLSKLFPDNNVSYFPNLRWIKWYLDEFLQFWVQYYEFTQRRKYSQSYRINHYRKKLLSHFRRTTRIIF